jgi:spermidine/putrescine transport system permease protein
MLSFSLSFDDFIITNLNAGNTTTFPMYVWGVSRKTIPMQINVVGTVMLLVSVLIVVGGEVNSRRRRRALSVDRPRRKDKALAAAGARSAAGTINPA